MSEDSQEDNRRNRIYLDLSFVATFRSDGTISHKICNNRTGKMIYPLDKSVCLDSAKRNPKRSAGDQGGQVK